MDAILAILILFSPVIIFVLINLRQKQVSDRKDRKDYERQQEQNVLIEKQVVHIGGHPYLDSNDVIYLQIKNDNKMYFYNDDDANTGDGIPIDQIIKYELKSSEQITKDVTLPGVLLFGVASLALKQENKSTSEYLYLSYIQNGVDIDCLFKNADNQSIGDIVSTLNRFKIERNKRRSYAS